MSFEDPETETKLDVPDTQGGVARASNGDRAVWEDADGANGGGVAMQDINALTAG
jgi:hypothetical protein